MKYLVDANVLSEPTKVQPAQQVVDWLRKHASDLTISAIVLGELEYGILLLPGGRKKMRLMKWFADGAKRLNALSFDETTANIWAKLLAELRSKGRAMPIKDSLIAATARQHQLTIATRNTSDYKHAGAQLIDPFQQ